MPQRDTHRFDRRVKAVAGRTRRQYRNRRIGVTPVYGLVKIRLFRFGRQTGRRAAALRIDDYQRQLGVDSQSDGLGLERDTRPGTRGDTDGPAVGCADRRTNRGNFVFRLESAQAQSFVFRQLVQQRGCRRNRIGTEQQRTPGQLGRGRETERERLGSGNTAIFAGRQLGVVDAEARQRLGQFSGLGIGMAAGKRLQVRLPYGFVIRELFPDPFRDRLRITIEHPHQQPQRPEILATAAVASRKSEGLDGFEVKTVDRDRHDLEALQFTGLARIGFVTRFGEAARAEAVAVEYDQRTGVQQRQADLERGRVEGDQHVRPVAGGRDRVGAEVHLVGGNAEGGADRGAYLGREVRESGEILVAERCRIGELRAHELNPVAGIARQAHHDRLHGFESCSGLRTTGIL